MFNRLWSQEARFQERKAYRDALKKARENIKTTQELTKGVNEAWARWWGSFHSLQAYAKHLEALVEEMKEEKQR